MRKPIIKKVILNRTKNYYKNDEESLRKQARDTYRNLSEEKENENQKHERKRYHNMTKEKKQKLKLYVENDREAKKMK